MGGSRRYHLHEGAEECTEGGDTKHGTALWWLPLYAWVDSRKCCCRTGPSPVNRMAGFQNGRHWMGHQNAGWKVDVLTVMGGKASRVSCSSGICGDSEYNIVV